MAVGAQLAGLVLTVIAGAIPNVALPTIAASLSVSEAGSIWVVTAYQLAVVVTLLPLAALGESHGYRRIFTGGLALFTLASAGCALAADLPTLIAARTLQGLGAGGVMAVTGGIVRYTYPQRRLGLAIGLNALSASLSAAVAPTAGALILTALGWPWLFALGVAPGLVALVAARALPLGAGMARRLRPASVLLNGAGLALLVLGIDGLGRTPLAGAGLLAAAGLCLGLLLLREAGQPHPLVPLDLLRNAIFRYSVLGSFCAFASQTMHAVAVPFLLHDLGFDALTTGLLMMPWPLTVALAAPVVGRMADRAPSALLCASGGGLIAAGLVGLAAWPLGGVGPLIACMMVAGLGFGCFQTPNNRTMMLAAPRERSGAAGGMQATARQFGQSAGAALVALAFGVGMAGGPRLALALAAGLGAAAAGFSLLRR